MARGNSLNGSQKRDLLDKIVHILSYGTEVEKAKEWTTSELNNHHQIHSKGDPWLNP